MNPKQQELVEKLKSANNILVTVSSNPSVDQLAACIGLTLLLNKLKKHATAVFSGNVPSTLEFLKPEETLEKNTDSLRDFIISLDKSKADKLRYKVEENVVKIFITPYKTSIGEPDLNFSQGDFNVDVVLCLGINQQQDLDQAITANGRILHDAVVASINTVAGGELGTINWTDPNASSLSELAVELADKLGNDLIDSQISTALLTGIVAETARFSNEKTSPNTMKISAELMSAGANQQLVASELQAPETPASPAIDENRPEEVTKTTKDGTLEIGHVETSEGSVPDARPHEQPKPEFENSLPQATEVPAPAPPTDAPATEPDHLPASRMMLQPPSMGGALTANSAPERFDPSVDPLTMMNTDKPILNHYQENDAFTLPQQDKTVQPPADSPPALPPSAEPTNNNLEEAILPDTTPLMLPDVAPLEPPEEEEQPDSNKPEPIFEPLPSEPVESKQPDEAKKPDNQIQIDTQGNLVMPVPPPSPVNEDSADAQSLVELEDAVNSSHIEATTPTDDSQTPDADAARDALSAIYSSDPNPPPAPKADVGASGYLRVQDLPDIAGETQEDEQPSYMPQKGLYANEPAPNASSPADQPLNMPLPPSLTVPPANPTPPTSTKSGPSSPPPVPPPFNPLP